MQKVVIPKSVETIWAYAFKGCRSLKEVVFEEGSRLTTIEENAFNDCSRLEKINFPEKLERIDMFAFSQTKLENVELPASLRKIGQGVF